MKQLHHIIFTSCLLLLTSCNEEVEYQDNECKRQPAFVKSIGFNPSRSAFSTSEKTTMGVVLLEVNPGSQTKKYQHPSWRIGGWMGPIQLDPMGNCFVGPVPVINVLNNPTAKQNIIYKLDGITGEMKVFKELPLADSIPDTNPYGILGFAYLCESNTLYVSTVQGSSRKVENGAVYAINAITGEIVDRLTGIDVLGMGISYSPGVRTLYMGSARTSDIYAVTLTKEGKFKSQPSIQFSLADLGPRGDDKVRRIRFNQYGAMLVHGVEFNFNLTAPTEKQETVYEFLWNETDKRWIFNR